MYVTFSFVVFANMEEERLVCYTATSHQGAIKIFINLFLFNCLLLSPLYTVKEIKLWHKKVYVSLYPSIGKSDIGLWTVPLGIVISD